MKQLILAVGILSLVACSGSDSTSGSSMKLKTGINQLAPQAQKEVVAKVKGPLDGIYLFDMAKYKSEQLKHADSIFKKMSKKDFDRMMQVFRPFKIEVAGEQATATFAHDVIKGELKTLEKVASGTRLFMTPVDKTKKDQTVTLIIEGDDLVLDPGKKESDKMYFKKVIDSNS